MQSGSGRLRVLTSCLVEVVTEHVNTLLAGGRAGHGQAPVVDGASRGAHPRQAPRDLSCVRPGRDRRFAAAATTARSTPPRRTFGHAWQGLGSPRRPRDARRRPRNGPSGAIGAHSQQAPNPPPPECQRGLCNWSRWKPPWGAVAVRAVPQESAAYHGDGVRWGGADRRARAQMQPGHRGSPAPESVVGWPDCVHGGAWPVWLTCARCGRPVVRWESGPPGACPAARQRPQAGGPVLRWPAGGDAVALGGPGGAGTGRLPGVDAAGDSWAGPVCSPRPVVWPGRLRVGHGMRSRRWRSRRHDGAGPGTVLSAPRRRG